MSARVVASEKRAPSLILDLFLTFVAACLVLLLAVMVILVSHSGSNPSASASSLFAPPVDCAVSSSFPAEVRQWCGLITQNAAETGLPADLIAALIWLESGGSPEAYSHSGAVGLMQVMPRDGLAAEFYCKGIPCFHDRPTIDELQDPAYNVRYGTRFLRDLVNFYGGDVREALRAYGPMDVDYRYADNVISLYYRYGAALTP